jgi:hypothetical protein
MLILFHIIYIYMYIYRARDIHITHNATQFCDIRMFCDPQCIKDMLLKHMWNFGGNHLGCQGLGGNRFGCLVVGWKLIWLPGAGLPGAGWKPIWVPGAG